MLKKVIRTWQGCLTSGGKRYASGLWMGGGEGLQSDSDLGLEFEDCPSADLNAYLTGYQGGAIKERGRGVSFPIPTLLG